MNIYWETNWHIPTFIFKLLPLYSLLRIFNSGGDNGMHNLKFKLKVQQMIPCRLKSVALCKKTQ